MLTSARQRSSFGFVGTGLVGGWLRRCLVPLPRVQSGWIRARVTSPGFLPGLVVGLLVMLAACNPASRPVEDDGQRPDMTMSLPPPPPCQKDRLRCSADRDATERCDGVTWQKVDKCKLEAGEQCQDGVCKSACELVTRGNVGCSFYPVNLWSTSMVGKLGIVVTNTSDRLTATVTLEDATGVIETQTIPPAKMGDPQGGMAIFRLDHGRNKLTGTELAKKGFHLSSTAPVAVYQFHPIDAATVFSGSATLLLPEHVMAKNYFVMSYTYNAELMTSPPQGQGFVAVVGLQDGTLVEVTSPVATSPAPGVAGLKPGETLKKFLNRYEVLEVVQTNSREDISGATVKASAPVAVFGGAGGVSVPYSAVGGNHFGVQMFPLETWGKKYLAAKVKQRNSSDKDYYRIVASLDGTQVTLSGGTNLPLNVPVLKKGQIFEFATDSDFVIEADKPILAFQYMPAWGNLSGRYDPKEFPSGVSPSCPFTGSVDDVKCLGDANITPLIPVEQFRSDYIFYVPQTYTYDYVNVLADADAKLVLDGVPVTETIRQIGAGPYGRAIIRLPQTGNHRITGSKPFGLIGYGYSYATSYSYAGGLNLDRINPIE